jgi:hypothetical protein
MAEGTPSAAALAVLLEEIRADRVAIRQHYETIRGALAATPWPEQSATLSVVAVSIHHFYGASEGIFERIARAFEGLPERYDRWHQELLERMSLGIDGIRPAVLRRHTAHALAPVLSFRHFFRHAYAVAFDARRLQLVAEDAERAEKLLREDLDAFEGVLVAGRTRA